MSDKIDHLALGSWLATATFQIGVSAKEAWQKWMRQRPPTDYERVLNGETRNGWRQVVRFRKQDQPPLEYYFVLKPWLMGDDCYREDAVVRSGFSVEIRHISPLPDGHSIVSYRRHSLIRPARKTLLQITHRQEDFFPECACGYANARTKYSVFRLPESDNFYVLLMDAVHGKSRSFVVVPPEQGVEVWFIYTTTWPKCRLHMVFRKLQLLDAWDVDRAEIFDVTYDLSIDSDSSQPKSPLSWESILVPTGGRSGFFEYHYDQAQVFALCDENHIDDTDAHLCISFDHNKSCRVQSMTQCLDSSRTSKAGSSVPESMHSFRALSPPVDLYDWVLQTSAVKFLRYMLPFGNVVFGITHFGGLWLRWRFPPSLKRLAIEAVFRAKEAGGFEFDDGIPDDEIEDDVDVIHLG